MTDESLKDAFNDQGTGAFQDAVYDEFDDVLAREVLFGEPLDTPDLHTAMRKYDHGQASDKTVVEYGIKIVFDANAIELSTLEEGGKIHSQLLEFAETYLDGDIAGYDVSFVDEDSYEVWVLLPESFF